MQVVKVDLLVQVAKEDHEHQSHQLQLDILLQAKSERGSIQYQRTLRETTQLGLMKDSYLWAMFLRSKPLEVPNLQVQGSSIPFGVKALRDDHEHQSHQLQLDIVLLAENESQYTLYNISKHCGKQPSWC